MDEVEACVSVRPHKRTHVPTPHTCNGLARCDGVHDGVSRATRSRGFHRWISRRSNWGAFRFLLEFPSPGVCVPGSAAVNLIT